MQVQVAVYPGDSLRALPREAASVLPVVIFSSATFNAATINPETLFLNAAKNSLSGLNGKSACHMEDPNRDGRLDLVCSVQTNATRAKPGMAQVALEGQTSDGTRFRGEFVLQLLPGPPARPAPAKH
ncbi:MAG: hypothetical protein HYR58_05575 [Acidobacteria bacterium]|nr:hypothetical protein [Acidobacteriota bacterium]